MAHKELLKKTADEQIQLLLDKHGIDWNAYSLGEKYGRLIYKESEHICKTINGKETEFDRSVWVARGCTPFDEEDNVIRTLIPNKMETIDLYSRYGPVHKLIPTDTEGIYLFQSAEEWNSFA